MRFNKIEHKFLESIPENIQEGTIYISIKYATATHLCCCGCGSKVITPISPTDWELLFNGESVTLSPSIANRFPCKSHYFIKRNKIIWVRQQTDEEIEDNREWDDFLTRQRISENLRKKLPKKTFWSQIKEHLKSRRD